MAFVNPFYQQGPLSVDTQHFDDNESILDENILDSAIFSPKPDDFQQVDMQPVASHNNPFGDNNPFYSTAANSYAPTNHWSMSGHDGLPVEFDPSAPFHRPLTNQGQNAFGAAGNHQMPIFSPTNTSGGSIPQSPQKDQWPETTIEQRSMPKRMRPHSPALRSQPEMSRRGDGIRKKNARFEIPAERNLTNIDQLIAQSTDEQEIKELKQQKRLLRNRQAAYDSPFPLPCHIACVPLLTTTLASTLVSEKSCTPSVWKMRRSIIRQSLTILKKT